MLDWMQSKERRGEARNPHWCCFFTGGDDEKRWRVESKTQDNWKMVLNKA